MVTCTKYFFLFLSLFFSHALLAQSFYQASFSMPAPNGTTTEYHSLLILFYDGSGIERIRFSSTGDAAINVIEADLENIPVLTSSGDYDTTKMIMAASKPRVIIGHSLLLPKHTAYMFVRHEHSGFMEPAYLLDSIGNTDPKKFSGINFSAKLVDAIDITPAFILQYFSDDEPFFTNMFNSRTRGLSAEERNMRMLLLAVGNTTDSLIGTACQKDLDRTIQTCRNLAMYLGIPLLEQVITGNGYGKKAVENALKAMKPSARDIVVFYYTGHGFRKPGQKTRYPFIDLREKPIDDYFRYSLNMSDIYQVIKKKGARLNLVLSDCCNTDETATNILGSSPLTVKSSGIAWSEDNVRKLFINSKPTSILATAADSTQRAACNRYFGGFFSYFFKSALELNCSRLKSNVSWYTLMEEVKLQTTNKASQTYCDKPKIPQNTCRQSPVYMVE